MDRILSPKVNRATLHPGEKPLEEVSVASRDFPSCTHHHRKVFITRRREFIALCEHPPDLSLTHTHLLGGFSGAGSVGMVGMLQNTRQRYSFT